MLSWMRNGASLALLSWTLQSNLPAGESMLWEKSFGLDDVHDVHVMSTGHSYVIAGTKAREGHGTLDIYVRRVDQGGLLTDGAEIPGEDFSSYSIADLASLGPDGSILIVGTNQSDQECGKAIQKGCVLKADGYGKRLTESLHDWNPTGVTVLKDAIMVAGARARGDPFVREVEGKWEVRLGAPDAWSHVIALRAASDMAIALVSDTDVVTRDRSSRLVAVDDAGKVVGQVGLESDGLSAAGLLTGPDRIHVVGTRQVAGGKRMALVELDAQGWQRWERTYLSIEGGGSCIGRSARGELLVGGWIREEAKLREGILLRVGEDGVLLGQKRFSRPGTSNHVTSVVTAPDGYLVGCVVKERSLSENRWGSTRPVFIRYRDTIDE